MTLLIDMNLSPEWVDVLQSSGLTAIHWSSLGAANAPDHEIFARAKKEGWVILTQDLDFSQILFETAASGPSTILLRLRDELNPDNRSRVVHTILQCQSEIAEGALLVIDDQKPASGRSPYANFVESARQALRVSQLDPHPNSAKGINPIALGREPRATQGSDRRNRTTLKGLLASGAGRNPFRVGRRVPIDPG